MVKEQHQEICDFILGILNSIEDAFYIKDLDGKYLYVNKSSATLIGKPIEEILGFGDSEIFNSSALVQIRNLDEQVVSTQSSVSVETHYKINRNEHYFQTLLSPAYSKEGNIVGIIGISRDITEYKDLIHEVEKSKEELDIILNNSADAIYRKDLFGRYVFINPAAAEMMNKTQEEILDHTDLELFGDGINKKIRKADRDVLDSNKPLNFTTQYTDGNHDEWFNVSLSPAFGGHNKTLGVIGISKNITEQKQLEMELRQSNEQLLTILEGTNDAIYAKDLDGKYLFVNSACEKHTGRKASDIIGKTDEELFDSITCETIQAFDKKVIETNQIVVTDQCFGSSGNEAWFHSTISPAYSADGKLIGIIGNSRNMTDYQQTQEKLWQSESRYYSLYHDTPAIFLTLDSVGLVIEANAYGASKLGYDLEEIKNMSIYQIIPPEDKNSFKRDLQIALDNPGTLYQAERRYISKEGKIIWGKDFVRVVYDKHGNASIPILSENITEAKELHTELSFRDTHDTLTGFLNLDGFCNELHRAMELCKNKNITHVLYVVELDNFKLVNDALGHDAGDKLLILIGEELAKLTRERDILGRLGGDEFAVLMENTTQLEAEAFVESVLGTLGNYKFKHKEKLFNISVSIGVVVINSEIENVNSAINKVEHAVFSAKSLGKNRIHFYDEEDDEIKSREEELETITNINAALENDQFELHAQKVASLQSDRDLPFYEILIRMKGDGGKLISPGKFLPILEHNFLVYQLDAWVISHTFDWIHSNLSVLEKVSHFSINISGQSLSNESLLDMITNLFIKYRIPYEKICFEITETATVSNMSNALQFINTLRRHGCFIALDDFGAGLSSFRYLRDIPVDYVKIDGTFIRNITKNYSDYMLTQGIHSLVKDMGMRTVAEFVEDKDIINSVKKIGVYYAQGHYVHPPQELNSIFSNDET